MALTRDHNVDDINRGLKVETLWGQEDDTEVTMGIADATSIYAMLSDLSAQPGAYVMRETWSNAYDATRRAGKPYLPVEIQIDEHISDETIAGKLDLASDALPHIRITDHGCGMTQDDIRNLFLQYGGSDKRDEVESVGSKGLGSKAPLAIADTFVVTTTKDGMTTTAVIEKRAGAANTAHVTTKFTGAENGTCVDIPVDKTDVLRQARGMANDIVRYVTDVPVNLNGQESKHTLPETVGHSNAGYVYIGQIEVSTEDGPMPLRVWERDDTKRYNHRFTNSSFPHLGRPDAWELYVLIAGVMYPMSTSRHSSEPLVIVEVEPGWLDFTPSRDEIKENKAKRELIEQIQKNWPNFDHSEALMRWLCEQGHGAFARMGKSLSIGKPKRNPYSYYSPSSVYIESGVICVNESSHNRLEMDRATVDALCPHASWLFEDDAEIPTFVSVYRDANARAHLSICERDIPANRVSKLTVSDLKTKFPNTADKFAAALADEDQIFWVCDMEPHDEAEDETSRKALRLDDLKTLMRALANWHTWQGRNGVILNTGKPKTANLTIVLDYHDGTVADGVKAYLGEHRKTTLAEVCEGAREMRRLQRTQPTKAARAKKNPLASTDWKSVAAHRCRVPHASKFTEGQMMQLLTVKPSSHYWRYLEECDSQVESLWAPNGNLLGAANGPTDAPLANVALVLCDCKSEHMYMNLTSSLAAVIGLARAHGIDIVPPEIDCVCLSQNSTPLKREVDSAKLNGAIVLADFRTNVQVLEESYLSNPEADAYVSGSKVRVSQRALFLDDDETAARWATLTNPNCFATGSEMNYATAARICLDATENTDDATLRRLYVDPVSSLLAEGGNADKGFYRWVPWRTEVTRTYHMRNPETRFSEMQPTNSDVLIKDMSQGAEELHELQTAAIKAACCAIRPLCVMTRASNNYAQVDDESRKAFQDMFSDVFAKSIRRELTCE